MRDSAGTCGDFPRIGGVADAVAVPSAVRAFLQSTEPKRLRDRPSPGNGPGALAGTKWISVPVTARPERPRSVLSELAHSYPQSITPYVHGGRIAQILPP